ncbi:hypothetical protein P153DRAFT_81706 [Dothidotthia symphoricarpi CBS 119687]|uniref:Uncharacterized protein n=1 Tax=Dothidotthia symphoricarpi CBS 119687 TaxID=1392245 RepID=A0A6A6A3P8_9PLEO|nr:uncharacterized protein P153DRAFT_81706 [Dothidotthia symphoricarpi CBS 119687]KAF2126642.1 hypothetical protein P153DRAFT_81706 [Dothidotthia symphoricarpi CBS 119687]
MTHAPPDDTEYALLIAWIDQRVATSFLQHQYRITHLLNTQSIARSVMETRFLSRVLSIYTQNKACQGLVGVDDTVPSSNLQIRCGQVNDRLFVGIMAIGCEHDGVVLRGGCRETFGEALESFVDTVLNTGKTYMEEYKRQREEEGELERREEQMERITVGWWEAL